MCRIKFSISNSNKRLLQSTLIDFNAKPINIITGPPGSGKTYEACKAAKIAFTNKQCRDIIITRPTIGTDGESLGYLPGDIDDKMRPWIAPIVENFKNIIEQKELTKMIQKEHLKIIPIAYMRGLTFGPGSFIIADEAQNLTITQFKCLVTRIGLDSKLVITGDLDQFDKSVVDKSGLIDFIDRMDSQTNLDYIHHFKLDIDDIVRHDAIKEILNIYKIERNLSRVS